MCFDVESFEANLMSEIVVSLKNVSKCFKRYSHPVDRLKEALLPGKLYAQPFWALQQINLEVAKGETLGILGRNGSGKSTLLQIIAGTLMPTTGVISVNGKISALLELGSGFNMEFTGRQNVFFNGQILGLSLQEIEERLDAIIAFADIGDFLDQPVKTYSSGMFIRLAFAVAVHVEPQVLIVDEALAVGDIFFQQKCFKRLDELRSKGVSIILVSHDTQSIVKLCDRVVILQNGFLKYEGNPSDMVAKYTELYYSQFFDNAPEAVHLPTEVALASAVLPTQTHLQFPEVFVTDFPTSSRYGSSVGLIGGVAIADINGQPQTIFEIGEEVCLSVRINPHLASICPLNIGFQVKDRLGQIMIGTNTCFLEGEVNPLIFGEPFICCFRFQLAIAPGQYSVVVAIAEHDTHAQVVYDWIEQAGVINVVAHGMPKQCGLHQPEILVDTVLLNQSLVHL
jgi:lipopolysaccharide transport system ATP-binding protein